MAKARKAAAKKPGVGQADVHMVLNARSRVLKCFAASGRMLWSCLARGEGVSGPGWTQTGGDTPPGLYSCDRVIPTVPGEEDYSRILEVYGPAFISLKDEEDRARGGATGIGIHGGRDRSPGFRPARALELAPTRGCVRVDNSDLMRLVVPAVKKVQAGGGTAWLTVSWE